MPSVARPRIWKAGETPRRVPKPLRSPKALRWEHPPPPAPPKRSPTKLEDESNVTSVLAQADEWSAQADKVEASIAERVGHIERTLPEIEIDLGLELVKMDRAQTISVDEMLKVWDRSGDGRVSKGEFRVHIREMGLTQYNMASVDAMFDRYDGDQSGMIELSELRRALQRMKKAANIHFFADDIALGLKREVASLRARVKAAREAVSCHAQVGSSEQELLLMKQTFGGRVDLQLGDLLVKRGISVGEMVGSWPKARTRETKSHAHELAKSEWKDEIIALGLELKDRSGKVRPASRKELGKLFDDIDLDKSGWLNLREAKQALAKWRKQSMEHERELEAKAREVMSLRKRASRLLQTALRAPQEAPRLPEPMTSSSMPATEPTPGITGIFSRFWNFAAMQEQMEKRAVRQAAKDKARAAILKMRQRRLAQGWVTWCARWRVLSHQTRLLTRAVACFAGDALARGWRTWLDEHNGQARIAHILNAAGNSLQTSHSMPLHRSFHLWAGRRLQLNEWHVGDQRTSQVAKSIVNALRFRPKLRLFFRWWRSMARDGTTLLSSPDSGASGPAVHRVEDSATHWQLLLLCVAVAECLRAKVRAGRS